jgi:hypothetical protein
LGCPPALHGISCVEVRIGQGALSQSIEMLEEVATVLEHNADFQG